MSVSAVVKNGEIVTSTSQNSISAASSSADSVNKEDFLQLLVAQMQYQDPLEPTDNTEWVTQYAQFSQVEELQNMSASMELTRASSLVGQTVIMQVSEANGNTTQVQGNVDYVSYEAGKAYLSINGALYSMEDLSLVVDDIYLSNLKAATGFVEALDALPDLSALAVSDRDAVEKVKAMYDELNEQSIGMIDKDYKTVLDQYVSRMNNLVAIEEKGE